MRPRVVAISVLGFIAGALLGALLLTPLVARMSEPMGWDEKLPDPFFLGFGVLFLLWTGYLGGRFAYKVATYEEKTAAAAVRPRTWTGAGWTLSITPDLVEVATSAGVQRFEGDRMTEVFLTRTGTTWHLELPDGSIRALEGIAPKQAEEISEALRRLSSSS